MRSEHEIVPTHSQLGRFLTLLRQKIPKFVRIANPFDLIRLGPHALTQKVQELVAIPRCELGFEFPL